MFLWFKETNGFRSLINIEQIVRIAPSGVSDSVCRVHLADGHAIAVDHSIDNIEETLAVATNPSHAPKLQTPPKFRAVK
jgi:hypothetical protein